jgi:hypothetical protein
MYEYNDDRYMKITTAIKMIDAKTKYILLVFIVPCCNCS